MSPPIDVVLVAGGRSRRLGRDKAVLLRGRGRQVDHVVDAVRSLGGAVIVAHGARPLDVDGTTGVADHPDQVGPLAGVVAGLLRATTDVVALVAVDLVAPDVTLLRALAGHVRAHDLPGAMPLVDGRGQPLHAVVRRDTVDRLVSSGPRLLAALEAAGVVAVPEQTWRTWSPHARPADDIDTPDDLAAIRRSEQDDRSPTPPTVSDQRNCRR